ncbi:MAG: enoyl-CoA hydratase [Myxococcales bacterium]|nr:enoyl-CoA hydratase [Myxococcales bacterium]|tara:strand:+ start:25 stop:795 length:771 start_codon:yes stop_codon:yes gene_type:complete
MRIIDARVQIETSGQIAWLRLHRPKANAIDPTMVEALLTALDELEADPTIRGVILCGAPGMFCAGLDVVALFDLDHEAMSRFWNRFNELMLRLLGSPLIIMSAIAGHSPAGGCVLAIMTDYRVLAEGRYKIGLNEVGVGIAMPQGVVEVFRSILGHRPAERLGLTGALIGPDEALAIGLVDELAPLEEVESRTQAQLTSWLTLAETGQRTTKHFFRKRLVDELRQSQTVDEKAFIDVWFSEDARATLAALVQRLRA